MSSEDKWYISGPLAIGTSEPTGQLTVEGNAQPNQGRLTFFSASADVEFDGGKDGVFVFRNTAPNGKTAFIGGNLGIGTGDPTHPLHVKTNWGFLALDTNAAGQDSGIRLMEGGAVKWHIYNSASAKKLFIDRDGLHGSLTIDGSGNVGIGTSNPTHPLHLKTNWGFLALDTNAAGQDSGIRLMEGGAVKWHIYNSASAKKLFIDRDGLHGSITIDESGNVGIGTSTPTGRLHVQGDIRAGNSDIYFTKTDHTHSGIGNATGHAAIENASDFDALMILGRAGVGTDTRRKVKLWDYLEVNGNLNIIGTISLSGELPFHYHRFEVPKKASKTDTGWESNKYVAIIVGFDFPAERFPSRIFIDSSEPKLQLHVWHSSDPSAGSVHVLRLRKEIVTGL